MILPGHSNQSNILHVLPIYAASEKPIEGINSQSLCIAIKEHGHKDVNFSHDFQSCLQILKNTIKPDDLVLTLGAGNVYTLGDQLLENLH